MHFTEIRNQLKAGNLSIVTKEQEIKKVNATEYVETRYVNMFEKDITDIRKMKTDEETKPILHAALELFQQAAGIYKTDFVRIAKMIDEGKPDEEIDTAIKELDINKGPIVDEKFNKVYDLIMPYADKHGVDYKIMNNGPASVNYKQH